VFVRQNQEAVSAIVSRIWLFSLGTITLTALLILVLAVAGLRDVAAYLALIWIGGYVVLEGLCAFIRSRGGRAALVDRATFNPVKIGRFMTASLCSAFSGAIALVVAFILTGAPVSSGLVVVSSFLSCVILFLWCAA